MVYCMTSNNGRYLNCFNIVHECLFHVTSFYHVFNFFQCLIDDKLYHNHGKTDIMFLSVGFRNLANNETKLESSPTFPRITMCEFQVRTLGEVLTYNVQCVLPLNLFNEKIFLFLWMWIVFVLLATCTNMVG